jgi:hypothetical protein
VVAGDDHRVLILHVALHGILGLTPESRGYLGFGRLVTGVVQQFREFGAQNPAVQAWVPDAPWVQEPPEGER